MSSIPCPSCIIVGVNGVCVNMGAVGDGSGAAFGLMLVMIRRDDLICCNCCDDICIC